VSQAAVPIKTRRWAFAGFAALWGMLIPAMAGCDGSVLPLLQPPFEAASDAGNGSGVVLAELAPTPEAPPCVQAGSPATEIQQAMFEAINRYRVSCGLEPLIYSKTLEAAASAHAEDLWVRDFFSHANPDGELPPDRALAAGFCHRYVGENLAAGQTTVEQMMDAFRASPSHDANMLEPQYVYVGMGFSVDPRGRRYWCQLFAFDVPELNAQAADFR